MTQHSDFRADIDEVLKALNLPADDFRLVGPHDYELILVSILDRFITLGKKGLNYSAWWDSFKEPFCSIWLEDVPGILKEFIPLQENVWFVIEDWKRTKWQGNFWLYEGTIAAITDVIKEMYGFEYYIVSKKFEWLLGEDHHGVLIGVGNSMTEKIEHLKFSLKNNP
ncbi:MAG: hypothetical protein KME12_09795 [Trichocoleus desertorum ATA4-8-CV12]|jgi:hypothetical protein|nr:hypothetical protein [Trichocoleus desertorum ATA4-8-CV12]